MSFNEIKCDFNLNSYDMIAIDMDNTLVKYNLKNSLPLIHGLCQTFLVQLHNYPKDICEEFCPKLCQKGLIIDKKRGNVLKLDSSYQLSARHGFKLLSEDEIQSIYGELNEDIKRIPDVMNSANIYSKKDFDFTVIKDYFSSPLTQVFTKTVEVMDKLSTSSSAVNYWQIWDHIYEVCDHMFNRSGYKTRTGGWFPELIANTDKYLLKSSEELKQLLQSLRKSGKLVVLITASNVDYVRLLMDYSYGRHWTQYFDFVITFARKPMFFTRNDNRFLAIDSNDNIENEINSHDLQLGRIYAEGNWSQLKTFLAKHLLKSDPKCLYIGDSFNDDCIVPNKYVDCNTVAVVEELEEDIRPELDTSYWKSFFGDNHHKKSLWFELLTKHTKLIVPKIDCLVDYY